MDNCSICYTKLNNRNNIKLKCGHLLHYTCMSHHMYFSDKKTCPLCRDNIIISDVVLDKLDSNNISYVFTKIIMNNKSLMYCSSNTKYLGIKRKCRNKAFPENNGCCRIHHTFNIDISFFKLIFTIFIFIILSKNTQT